MKYLSSITIVVICLVLGMNVFVGRQMVSANAAELGTDSDPFGAEAGEGTVGLGPGQSSGNPGGGSNFGAGSGGTVGGGLAPGNSRRVRVAPRPSVPLIDIDADGITVGQYIEYIRAQSKTGVNVICTEAAENIKLPKIKIKCSAATAIEILPQVMRSARIPVMVDGVHGQGGQGNVYIVDAFDRTRSVATVVNVNSTLATLRAKHDNPKELLEETINVGLDISFKKDKASITIQLHEKSGLLFIKATKEQSEFIMNIVSSIG